MWFSGFSARACKPRGRQFDSWSGHVPGLWASPPLGCEWEATHWCFSPSLSPSLPLSLKIKSLKNFQKQILKQKKDEFDHMKITTKNTMDRVNSENFPISRMDKGQTSRIYEKFLYINKNKTSSLTENMNRQFIKKGIWEANKHMKRCLIITKKHAN